MFMYNTDQTHTSIPGCIWPVGCLLAASCSEEFLFWPGLFKNISVMRYRTKCCGSILGYRGLKWHHDNQKQHVIQDWKIKLRSYRELYWENLNMDCRLGNIITPMLNFLGLIIVLCQCKKISTFLENTS